jgi:hypothetical protein
MKMDCVGLPLSQKETYLVRCLFKPSQVHPGGPHVGAADNPATFLKAASLLLCPARLYHGIQSHSGKGNEKIREKPLRVLLAERFRHPTAGHGDLDPHIFQVFRLAVAARDITVDLERMHFSA